ncbi:Clathrin, heavy chain isoform 1 [Hibiscus syriacus]|uniref:Clathrin, heavy chain isoform 1 n=1 Tax=Hibiscus syriacus TaxID=106335 RepID=A0A6A3AD17_HIBSY|nr:Clathrin, heavy chain isoform 1 [Hibiscus syriacus]
MEKMISGTEKISWNRGKCLGKVSFGTVTLATNESDSAFFATTTYRNLHMEYLPGGTVAKEAIVKSKLADVEEKILRWYTRCLVSALSYVHSEGIVHCDVKGKMFWWAMIQHPDVWSLGCTVIQMVTGKPAWEGQGFNSLNRMANSDELPEIPTQLSEIGKDFVDKCLRRDRNQRWSSDQLLQHPFVASASPPNMIGGSSPAAFSISPLRIPKKTKIRRIVKLQRGENRYYAADLLTIGHVKRYTARLCRFNAQVDVILVNRLKPFLPTWVAQTQDGKICVGNSDSQGEAAKFLLETLQEREFIFHCDKIVGECVVVVALAIYNEALRVRTPLAWCNPNDGLVKANSDRAVQQNDIMAAVGVHDLLLHAWRLGFRRIELETDNLEVNKIWNHCSEALIGNALIAKPSWKFQEVAESQKSEEENKEASAAVESLEKLSVEEKKAEDKAGEAVATKEEKETEVENTQKADSEKKDGEAASST